MKRLGFGPAMRSVLAFTAVGVIVALQVVFSGPSSATAPAAFVPPKIGHVWVIELENKSFDAAFVANTNTYLWKTLPSQGVLLRQYYGTGHASLDNYISETSGQAPNHDTQGDCQTYQDFISAPGAVDTLAGGGQAVGQGCVYPTKVKTIFDQLTEHGKSWRGYMQDMGLDPSREEALCGRPTTSTGQPIDPASNGGQGGVDTTQGATARDQYAARHNPFVYFHSVIDDIASCRAHVVPLVTQKTGLAAGVSGLSQDLAKIETTPQMSFITPNLCDDGHDATCAGKNAGGKDNQGGLYSADQFLRKYVPMITASSAYKKDGILIITLDESGDFTTPSGGDKCCNEPTGPNTQAPGLVSAGGGGGRTGTVILSPFIRGGTDSDVPYNHYSMLRSLEDIFSLGATAAIPGSDGAGHLGYAGETGLVPFGVDVFSNVTTAGNPANGRR